jgi:triacylglycerol lipase
MQGYLYEIFGILALLVLLGAGLFVAHSRRRKLPLPEEPLLAPVVPREVDPEPLPPSVVGPTRHPIVLVHGFAGFDSIRLGRERHDYFRGIRKHLEKLGHRVEVVRLPPLAGVENRASRLVEQVRALGSKRVNLVAHSMGGLDARYAITKLGLADCVASLTTVGTPHRGTPIANGTKHLASWLRRLGAEGIWDVSTHRMLEFNRDVPDVPEVEYFSYVSSVDPRARETPMLLKPALLLMGSPSDGLVPLESQRWGNVAGELAVDHWGQIGWSRGFDAGALYEQIALRLWQRGL